MIIPTFAISPDKNKGDKTKTDNLTSSLPPPPPWLLRIQVIDPSDTCLAILHCNLGFFIQPRSPNCGAWAATPTYTVPITWCKTPYYVPIPDTIPCVEVSIIVIRGNCPYKVSSNTCCTCNSGGQGSCSLQICP